MVYVRRNIVNAVRLCAVTLIVFLSLCGLSSNPELFAEDSSDSTGKEIFSESFDTIYEGIELYQEWYSNNWEKMKLKSGMLEFSGVFMRRSNYADYSFSGELGALRGSLNGKEKAYLLLKQPAGFGTGEKELGLSVTDLGDGKNARPGYAGILIGLVDDTVEIVIHTINTESASGFGNESHQIILPSGINFSSDSTEFEILDSSDSIEVRIGGKSICILELGGIKQSKANDWTGDTYTQYNLKNPDGSIIASGENAIVPCVGSVGLLAQSVVGKINTISLNSLSANPESSVISPLFFDESAILLSKGQSAVSERSEKIIGIPEICICVIAGVLAAGACAVAFLFSKKKGVRFGVSGAAVLSGVLAIVLVLTGIINFSGTKKVKVDVDNVSDASEGLTLEANGNTRSKVIKDDNTATDLLGRKLYTYEEVGAPKTDKYVGVFYTLWTCMADSLSDNTKNIAQNPDNPAVGPYASFHWFTEPETGYATSMDEWVVRRNLRYLAMAGVDYIYLDFTNGGIYEEAFNLLLDTSLALRAEGNDTPAIVPWIFASDTGTMTDAGYLYRKFYSQEKYRELWFYVQGKPLILLKRVEEDIAVNTWPKSYLPVLYNEQFTDFFTTRFAWVPSESEMGTYPGQPVYRWSWCNPLFMHNYKPDAIAYSWDTDPSIAEQITIIGGSYCDIGYGRSGENGTLDRFREKEVTGQGLYLEEQFEWVMENHPEVTYLQISGWNEWIAQYFEGFGSFGFVDSYNREFSRDMAPIKGGYEDNYFYQMCNIIRRFKGVEPQNDAAEGSIDIGGSFVQWDGAGAEYADFTGDTVWRDSTDTTGTIQYVDCTGRNDIAVCKTVCDNSHVYFYAETVEPLKDKGGTNWMLLFIDTDNDTSTGFEGYDRLINYELADDGRTTVCAYTDNVWQEIGTAEYRAEGSQLMIKVARSLLNQTESSVSFGFHWLDNVTNIYDMSDWFLTGDSAPERRARFTFSSQSEYNAGGEGSHEPRTEGRIYYMPALEGEGIKEEFESGISRNLYYLVSMYGKQPELNLLKLKKTAKTDGITVDGISDKSFAAEFTGYVYIDADDIYDFLLKADDGAILYIDGHEVIDIRGVHAVLEGKGYLPLAEGYHLIKLEYFENGDGNPTLSLAITGRNGGSAALTSNR